MAVHGESLQKSHVPRITSHHQEGHARIKDDELQPWTLSEMEG